MSESPGGAAGLKAVLERLVRLYGLDGAGAADLDSLLRRRHLYEPGAAVSTPDQGSRSLKVMLSGWAARTRDLSDGRRQIITFLIPGDVISMRQRAQGWASTFVTALTKVEAVEVSEFCDAAKSSQGDPSSFGRACDAAAASEDNIVLNQVVRLGLQGAHERMAHLFLELSERLKRIGLSDGRNLHVPLKQEHLGEALGMSLVHVNRTLTRLRGERLVAWKGANLALLEPARLAQLAQYEPVLANLNHGASSLGAPADAATPRRYSM